MKNKKGNKKKKKVKSDVRQNKILLNGMFKNESHIIHQMLNSLYHICDAYVMVDTGSSDNTIQIVKDFMEEKDIPGIVHEEPWLDDFGGNRTQNMEFAEKWIQDNMKPNETWYVLVMDADDRLVDQSIRWTDASTQDDLEKRFVFDKNELFADYIQIDTKCGPLDMDRPIMIKYDPVLRWKWYCPRHEYLSPRNKEIKFNTQRIKSMYLLARSAGSRSKDSLSGFGDVKAILKWLRQHQKTEDDYVRMTFYLAQTYKGIECYEEGEKYYLERADMSGWIEENYISLYEAASCRILSNKDDLLVEYYLNRAIQILPNRLEARYAMVRRKRVAQYYNEGWGMGASFVGCRDNKKQYGLKVENYIYDWMFDDEAALCLFYAIDCGTNEDRFDKAKKIWKNLADNYDELMIPENELKRINKCIESCDKSLAQDNKKGEELLEEDKPEEIDNATIQELSPTFESTGS